MNRAQMLQNTSRDYRKKNTFILGKHCRCDITPETCVLYEKCQNDQECPGGQCVYGDFGGVEYHYCQCNLTEPEATCIEKTKCQTNEDCPGGWCFNTVVDTPRKWQKICKCNDPIVPTMDCVEGAFCKDDLECGPKGECPTSWRGAAAGRK